MEKSALVLVAIVLILVVAGVLAKTVGNREQEEPTLEVGTDVTTNEEATMATMTLTSDTFVHDALIPSKYTCDGDNSNPPLEWSGVPEGARSLVLIMDDPDAVKPAGKVWDHWVVFNMNPQTRSVEQGIEPNGVLGVNSGGGLGYQGPCPPDGEHRYVFKLYALDTTLDLTEGATKAHVEQAMEGHVLAQGELIGRYVRE